MAIKCHTKQCTYCEYVCAITPLKSMESFVVISCFEPSTHNLFDTK